MIMTQILLSVGIPVLLIILAVSQLRKAQLVAIQKGGKAFVSSRVRVIVCLVIAALMLGVTYYCIWAVDYRLALAPMGVSIVPLMMAVTSYCAVSDSHLFVSQPMKLGAVSIVKTIDKVGKYQVIFRYNGMEFGHVFDEAGYEYIKEAKAKIKEIRSK